MNKEKLREIILRDCISFTVVSVIMSLLSFVPDLTSGMGPVFYLELFVCTTLIAVMITFTSKIPVESQIAANLIGILDVGAVIYGVGGGIFSWFPWELKYVIEVAVILIFVFIITSWVLFCQNNEITKAINKKIKEQKK